MTMKRERLLLPSGRLVFIETVRGPRYDLVTYRPGRPKRPKAPKARAPKAPKARKPEALVT